MTVPGVNYQTSKGISDGTGKPPVKAAANVNQGKTAEAYNPGIKDNANKTSKLVDNTDSTNPNIANNTQDILEQSPVLATTLRLKTQNAEQETNAANKKNITIGKILSGETQVQPGLAQQISAPILSFADNKTKLSTTSDRTKSSDTTDLSDAENDNPLFRTTEGLFEAIS